MRFLQIVWVVLLAFNAGFSQAEMTDEEKALYLEKYQADLKERVSIANVNIKFYGKIEDQNGDPVVGAEVEYGITSYSLVEVLDVSTNYATSDSTGKFEISNETGASLSIREIKLKGYSYYTRQNPRTGFSYWANLEKNRFVQNENEPIVFYVRKQGELTLTLKSNRLMSKDLDFEKVFYGSLKDGRVWPSDQPRFKFQRDFEMVAHRREGQDPILTITTLGDNSGILLSKDTIYTAPNEGYEKTVEIICEEDKEYFFFIKNQDGLYARIKGDFSTMEPDAPLLRTDMTSWLNPYGDQNLETESDIPIEIWIRLEREAKAAFRANKIPEKPDLQKLISDQ